MKLLGRASVGATAYPMDADTKRVARSTLPVTGNVAKGALYLDGMGGGSSPQACRQIVYDSAGNLAAVSDEVTVLPGQPAAWVDFSYLAYDGRLTLLPGDYDVGIHAGAFTDTIRVYGTDPHGAGGKRSGDTYADGASALFGAATVLTADLSGFITYFTPFAALVPVESPLYFSRLPYEESQYVLGLGGVEPQTQRLVTVGWHYTSVDQEQGAVAIVRETSPFVDLLGKRVQVATAGGDVRRTVNAYVHGLAPEDTEWDLSLSRTLFARLALLADDPFTASVSLIGDPA